MFIKFRPADWPAVYRFMLSSLYTVYGAIMCGYEILEDVPDDNTFRPGITKKG